MFHDHIMTSRKPEDRLWHEPPILDHSEFECCDELQELLKGHRCTENIPNEKRGGSEVAQLKALVTGSEFDQGSLEAGTRMLDMVFELRLMLRYETWTETQETCRKRLGRNVFLAEAFYLIDRLILTRWKSNIARHCERLQD